MIGGLIKRGDRETQKVAAHTTLISLGIKLAGTSSWLLASML